jgi:hypothetical protein
MTPRELRALLFTITNQTTTVSDLRSALFAIEAQDTELTQEALKSALAALQVATER